jgi:hyperosmotically inducible protein
MDSDEQTVQKRVVVNSPYQRSEVLSETTARGPRASRSSTGMIAMVAILAIAAIAVVLYLVSNRNANESANRNANLEVASQAQPTTIVQQPAPQAPVIIQQPAQPAPVIIQQPAQPSQRENTSANDDANMQDIATKKLAEDLNMAGVVMTITDARVVLTGTVESAATKAKAEQLVKAVRGVKSVDNQIVVLG